MWVITKTEMRQIDKRSIKSISLCESKNNPYVLLDISSEKIQIDAHSVVGAREMFASFKDAMIKQDSRIVDFSEY